jgi:hypothetical protein
VSTDDSENIKENNMTCTHRSTGISRWKRTAKPGALNNNAPEEEYRVGPGHPPKQYQFRPGQSGNPKGARRKTRSIAPDLKALLERALRETVTLRQGEKDRIVTKAAAGIEQLVNQYAKGDRYARRDLIDLANKLGVDLVAGQDKNLEEARQPDVTANDRALLADFVKLHGGKFDYRGDDSDTALPQEKNSETPDPINTRYRLPRLLKSLQQK